MCALRFSAVFEKLYLYKLTYSTERRTVRKVSYKIEVMVDEALLKQDKNVYGSYRPHRGKRMELHQWRGAVSWEVCVQELGDCVMGGSVGVPCVMV